MTDKERVTKNEIERYVAKVKQELAMQGLYDSEKNALNISKIETAVNRKAQKDVNVENLIYNAHYTAVALEHLENLGEAQQFYSVGCHLWMGDVALPAIGGCENNFDFRSEIAKLQLKAAICNDRVGNKERAKQLYGWAADNCRLTEMEIKKWQLESDLSMLWEPGTKWAYALLCAERYDEALEVAEKTAMWFKKQKQWTQDYDADYSIIFMIPTVLAVAKWKAKPISRNKVKALKMLDEGRVQVEDLFCALSIFFELFNLQARFR